MYEHKVAKVHRHGHAPTTMRLHEPDHPAKTRPTSAHAMNVAHRPACSASPPPMLPKVRRGAGTKGARASRMALFAVGF